ncbi:hypothetical protein GN278_10270 [Rhodobacteraceae bacterium Araon29]
MTNIGKDFPIGFKKKFLVAALIATVSFCIFIFATLYVGINTLQKIGTISMLLSISIPVWKWFQRKRDEFVNENDYSKNVMDISIKLIRASIVMMAVTLMILIYVEYFA